MLLLSLHCAFIALTTTPWCCQVLHDLDEQGFCDQVKLEDLRMSKDSIFNGLTHNQILEV